MPAGLRRTAGGCVFRVRFRTKVAGMTLMLILLPLGQRRRLSGAAGGAIALTRESAKTYSSGLAQLVYRVVHED
jgi:hypothetical protein